MNEATKRVFIETHTNVFSFTAAKSFTISPPHPPNVPCGSKQRVKTCIEGDLSCPCLASGIECSTSPSCACSCVIGRCGNRLPPPGFVHKSIASTEETIRKILKGELISELFGFVCTIQELSQAEINSSPFIFIPKTEGISFKLVLDCRIFCSPFIRLKNNNIQPSSSSSADSSNVDIKQVFSHHGTPRFFLYATQNIYYNDNFKFILPFRSSDFLAQQQVIKMEEEESELVLGDKSIDASVLMEELQGKIQSFISTSDFLRKAETLFSTSTTTSTDQPMPIQQEHEEIEGLSISPLKQTQKQQQQQQLQLQPIKKSVLEEDQLLLESLGEVFMTIPQIFEMCISTAGDPLKTLTIKVTSDQEDISQVLNHISLYGIISSSLLSFSITCNNGSTVYCSDSGSIIRVIFDIPSLIKLQLQGFSDDIFNTLFIQQKVSFANTLKSLHIICINNCTIPQPFQQTLPLLLPNTLISVNLNQTNVDGSFLGSDILPNLEELFLKECHELEDFSLIESLSSHRNLKVLDLSFSETINPESLISIIITKLSISLQELNLEGIPGIEKYHIQSIPSTIVINTSFDTPPMINS